MLRKVRLRTVALGEPFSIVRDSNTEVYLQYKEEKLMGTKAKPIYKVVHIPPSGVFCSVFVGIDGVKFEEDSPVDYIIGEVTIAPTVRGCYCWRTPEQAIDHATGKAGLMVRHPTAVLEVYPVGCEVITPGYPPREGEVRVQSVYVVREVWRESPELPMAKFEVGDKVVVKAYQGGKNPKGKVFTVTEVKWGQEGFGHDHYHYYYDEHNCAPCDEDWLELAPKWTPTIGSRLQFKACVVRPALFVPVWTLGKVGIYQGLSRNESGNFDVRFTSDDGKSFMYHCRPNELEPAPEPTFKEGDWVKVVNKLGAYAGVSVGMLGLVTEARYQECLKLTVPKRVGATKGNYLVNGKYLELVLDLERPLAEFQVGDRVRVLRGGHYPGTIITLTSVFWVDPSRGIPNADFGGSPRWLYRGSNWNYSADMLQLAPEPVEVWVDVTKECEPKMDAHFLCLYHNGHPILSFGSKAHVESSGKQHDYLVELTDNPVQGYFKILKKELV